VIDRAENNRETVSTVSLGRLISVVMDAQASGGKTAVAVTGCGVVVSSATWLKPGVNGPIAQ